MSDTNYNKYSEDISNRKAALRSVGTAAIAAISNLSLEVDSTQKTEPAVKEFSTYLNPDIFLENVANRYKI